MPSEEESRSWANLIHEVCLAFLRADPQVFILMGVASTSVILIHSLIKQYSISKYVVKNIQIFQL